MILDCLPKNAAGEAIRIELKKQAQEILDHGLSYQLKGKQYQEKFFSLEPLKQALKTYSDKFNGWNWSQRTQHWCTVVGAEQLLLTAYIRQHYCDPDEPFYTTPAFTKKQFTRSLIFTHWAGNCAGNCEEQIWDSGFIGLGVDFAITSGDAVGRCGSLAGADGAGAARDFSAITALDKVRTETDLPLLMQRLHEVDVSSKFQYNDTDFLSF